LVEMIRLKGVFMKVSHKICAVFNIVICAAALVGFFFAAIFAIEALVSSGVEEPDVGAGLTVGFGLVFFYVFGLPSAALSVIGGIWSAVLGFTRHAPEGNIVWIFRVPCILNTAVVVITAALVVITGLVI